MRNKLITKLGLCLGLVFFAFNSNAQYCSSTATNAADTYCKEVQINANVSSVFNSSANPGGQTSCETYTDFSGMVARANPGSVVDFTITSGACNVSYYNTYVIVYLDINGDGDYDDPGEELGRQNIPTSGPYTVNISWQVPVTMTLGVTGIRVIVSESSFQPPCGTYSYGETEDYSFQLVPNPQPNDMVVSGLDVTGGCSGNAAVAIDVYNNTGSTVSIPFDVRYSVAGGNTATETITATIPDQGAYTHTFATAPVINSNTFQITGSVLYPNDPEPNNDQITKTFSYKIPLISPLLEDFESNSNCSGYACTSCDIEGGFVNLPSDTLGVFTPITDNADWQVYNGDYYPTTTGPSVDHTLGTSAGKYIVYNSCTQTTAILESRCLNMSAAVNPHVILWYHMYGDGMGQLHVDIVNSDGSVSLDVVPPITDNKNEWQMLDVDFNPYKADIGNKLRLRVTPHPNKGGSGDMALDDIGIFDLGTEDLALASIVSPISGCGLASADVEIQIQHNGTGTIPSGTAIPVSYNINGSVVNETLTLAADLVGGATVNYTFNTPGSFPPGPFSYQLSATVSHANDIYNVNDTETKEVRSDVLLSLPLDENFDNYGLCNTTCTTPCNIFGGGIYNASNDGTDWIIDKDGTPSTNTGPSQDHTTGSGNYAYVEAASGCYSAEAFLETYCLDFSTVTNPKMSVWYHIFGTYPGVIHFDIKLGDNPWVNDFSVPVTSNLDEWQLKEIDLQLYAGEPIVKLRIRGTVNPLSTLGDFAIDDWQVFDAGLNDVFVSAINSPTSGCGLTNAEEVSVSVTNAGPNAIAAGESLDMSFTLDGNVVTETFVLPLPLIPMVPQNFTFTNTVDASMFGNYTFSASAGYVDDQNKLNDTLQGDFQNQTVSTFPYTVSFDNDPICKASSCGTSECELNELWDDNTDGVSDTINWYVNSGTTTTGSTGPSGAYSGSNYLYLEAYTTACYNASGMLESPCLDFTNLANPGIEFYYYLYGAGNGKMRFDVSTDGGATWQRNYVPRWTDNFNGWQLKSIAMPDLAGEANVKLRITGVTGSTYQGDVGLDEISVFDFGGEDLTIEEIITPKSSCALTDNEDVIIRIKHNGTVDIASGTAIPVSYTVDGSAVNDVLTLAADFVAGTTIDFTFGTPADLSQLGIYNLQASVDHAADVYPNNNTIDESVESLPSVQPPYADDFDSNGKCSASCTTPCNINSLWKNLNTDSHEWVSWFGGTGSANTGPSGDHTTGTGVYLYMETSSCYNSTAILESPCFDFSGVVNPKLSFWYHMYGANMGTMHFDVNDGTGWQENFILPWTDNIDLWQEKVIDLSAFVGTPTMRFRIRGVSGNGLASDMAIDDIAFGDAGNQNLYISEVLSPSDGCDNSSQTDVSIRVYNDGSVTILSGTDIPVSYELDGGNLVSELFTLTSDFLPGTTVDYTFTQTANARSYGTHLLKARVDYPADVYTIDNEKSHNFFTESIDLFPHLVTFGSQTNCDPNCTTPTTCEIDAEWRNVRDTDVLDWGVYKGALYPTGTGPQTDHTTATSSGSYVFVESDNAQCAGKIADLISPCYDFSNMILPKLKFWYHMFGGGGSQLRVDVSTDGVTYNTIVPYFTDDIDEWQQMEVNLEDYAGEPLVRIVFSALMGVNPSADIALDDIEVVDFGKRDLSLEVVPIASACGLSSTLPIDVTVHHLGIETIPSGEQIPVRLYFDGTHYDEIITLTADFDPATSINYTFNQTVDASVYNTYDVSATVRYSQDVYAPNDSSHIQFRNLLINTFSIFEDFESQTLCTTSSCTTTCAIENAAWFNSDLDDVEWIVDNNGTSTGGTGPNNDHTTGTTGKYVYLETANSDCENGEGWLLSSCLDLSTTIYPSLNFWYHMYGANMGSMHLDVQVNGGAWQNDFIPSWTGNSNQWQEKTVDLRPLNGQQVTLRIRGVMGAAFTSDMAVDDILIEDRGNYDFVGVSIDYPTTSDCDYTDSEQVVFTFRNDGLDQPAGEPIDLALTVNGNVYNEVLTLPSALPEGASYTYTFNQAINLRINGNYNISAEVKYSQDINSHNNSAETSFRQNLIASAGLPYISNFEDQDQGPTTCNSPYFFTNGWVNLSTDDIDWTVDQGGTTSLVTGPDIDHTRGNTQGKYIYLEASSPCFGSKVGIIESPCIDLDGVFNPVLSFWYHMFGESMGDLHLDILDGNGVWHTDFIPSTTGNEDLWKNKRVDLSQFAGENIKIRFRGITGPDYYSDMALDDIEIFEVDVNDMFMRRVLAPLGGCNVNLDEKVRVEVLNNGIDDLPAGTELPFTLIFEGDTIRESITLTAPLLAGDFYEYTFNQSIHLPNVGLYNFNVSVNLVNENLRNNDSLLYEFRNETVNRFPAVFDFEEETGCTTNCGTACEMIGAWQNVFNDQKDWIAHKGSTPTSGTGPTGDHTTGNGYYAYFEADNCNGQNAFLTGPCLNFSDVDEPSLILWYHMKGSQMGTLSLDVKIGGGFWFFDYIPAWTSNTNGWQQKRIDLPQLAGFQRVQFRLRATAGNGNLGDIAVDDILVIDCKTPEVISESGRFDLCTGQQTILTAKPDEALEYRWYKNGVLMTGINSQSIIVSDPDSAYYHVETDFPYGCTKASDSVKITFTGSPSKPSISPAGVSNICRGEEVTFVVRNEYDNYQWYKDGVEIVGATDTFLITNEAGDYHLEVFKIAECRAASDVSVINFYQDVLPATASSNGSGSGNCNGVVVTVSLDNSYSFYQWYRNGQIIPNANDATYQASIGGCYSAYVQNQFGCDTTSTEVCLDYAFEDHPQIAAQGPTSFCDGGFVRLNSTVYSDGMVWHKNGQVIPLVTAADYVARESGNYFTVVTKEGCTDTSNTIQVTVFPAPAVPTISPRDTASCDGSNVLLRATVTGNLQWYRDGNRLPGATNANYVASNTGAYSVVATSPNGCTNADTIFFTKFGLDAVDISPDQSTVCSGKAKQLCSSVPIGNQWYFNGNPIGGATGECVWVSQPGQYYVINTQDTCVGYSDTVVVNQTFGQDKPVITVDGSDTFCPNELKKLTSTNAVQYQWMLDGTPISGANTKTYMASADGIYQVIATNQFGCSDTSVFTNLYFYNGPQILNVEAKGSACPGRSDGTLEINIQGGDAPVTFSIDGTNWQASPFFGNLTAGTYTAMVQDGNGCIDTLTATIEDDPSDLGLATGSANSTCPGGDDAQIFVSGFGGRPSYIYTLSNGDSNNNGTFKGLAPGAYTVTMEDQFGCSITSDTIVVTEPNELIVNAIIDQPISCYKENDGVIQAAAIGGTPGYGFSIDGGLNYQASPIFTGLEPNFYQIHVQDANGCVAQSLPVEIIEPDSLEFGNLQILSHVDCYGESTGLVIASGQGGTAPYEYSTDGVNYGTSQLISGLTKGEYTIYVRDERGCVSISDTLKITEGSELSISAQVDSNIVCYDYETGVISVNASGGTGPLEYAIDLVNYQSSNVFTDLPAALYDNITVRDSLGCVQFASPVTITQPAIYSVVTNQVSNISCNGQQDGIISLGILGGSGNNLISIDGGQTYSTDSVFTGLPAGSYDVQIKDVGGCVASLADPIIITEPSALSLDSIRLTPVSCFGLSNGVITMQVLGGTPPLTYSVDSGQTYTSNPIRSGLTAGTYHMIVKDAMGCELNLGSATITQPSQLLATASQTGFISCFGDSNATVTLSATGGSGIYSYSKDGGQTVQGNPVFTGLPAGIHSFTVTDNFDCEQVVQIQINQPAELQLSNAQINNITCFGDNNGMFNLTAIGGSGVRSFSIDGGQSYQTNGVFNGLPAGTYQVTIKDANGCETALIPLTISEPDSLYSNLVVVQNLDCATTPNGGIKASTFGGVAPYTYSLNGAPAVSDSVFSNLNSGTYGVTVVDANGCIVGTDSVTLTAPAAIQVSSTVLNHISCFNANDGAAQVSATGGAGNFTYSSDGQNFGPSNVFSNLGPGLHVLYVKDQNGCVAAAQAVNILNANQLYLTSTVDNHVSCFGASDALILSTGTGGTAGAKLFNINNGPWLTTGSFQNLPAGTYIMGMQDADGCETYDTLIVTEPDLLDILVDEVVLPTGASSQDGRIRISVLGGTPQYTYVWSNGATTQDIFNLNPGTYKVTVKDANDCILDTTFIVTSTVGIEEELKANFNMYPNPASEQFIIELDSWNDPAKVKIFDDKGVLVYSRDEDLLRSGEYKVNTSDWAAGVYSVLVYTDELTVNQSIVIIR